VIGLSLSVFRMMSESYLALILLLLSDKFLLRLAAARECKDRHSVRSLGWDVKAFERL